MRHAVDVRRHPMWDMPTYEFPFVEAALDGGAGAEDYDHRNDVRAASVLAAMLLLSTMITIIILLRR